LSVATPLVGLDSSLFYEGKQHLSIVSFKLCQCFHAQMVFGYYDSQHLLHLVQYLQMIWMLLVALFGIAIMALASFCHHGCFVRKEMRRKRKRPPTAAPSTANKPIDVAVNI
jgi:hypothetical protein